MSKNVMYGILVVFLKPIAVGHQCNLAPFWSSLVFQGWYTSATLCAPRGSDFQSSLEMVALLLSGNTGLPLKTLTVPSWTSGLPSACNFYYPDLNISKWARILWENKGRSIGCGWFCAGTASWLDPRVGLSEVAETGPYWWVSLQLCF